MFSWIIVKVSTEPLWCSLCSLIQKPSLLNRSFKNKTICSTGISTGIIPMEKKIWAGRQDYPEKLLSKSQVTTIYKTLSYMDFDSKTRRTGMQSDSRIGMTLPTGGITAATNN